MRRFALATAFILAGCLAAAAQGCGPSNPNCIVPTAPNGDSSNRAASTAFVQNAISAGGSLPLTHNYLYLGNVSNVATAAQYCLLTNGCLGGDQSAATAHQVPVYPGSGGAAVPTTITPAIIGSLGTGVATALGVNVGTAGSPVINGGALGTPSSGIGTNLTGIPFSGLAGSNSAAQIAGSGASHAVPVDVAGTPTWKVVPDCQDSNGNHINYTQSTDVWSCGTSSSSTIVANSFYVKSTGTDTANDCRTSGSPCLTITHAVNEAFSFNAGGAVQTIFIQGSGAWNETVAITGNAIGAGNASHNNALIIDGGGAITWNGVSGQCGTLVVNNGANVQIQNITMKGTGDACQSSLYAQMGGLIQVTSGVLFDAASQSQMFAEGSGSQIQIWNSYHIIGGAAYHITATSGAHIEINPTSVVVTFNLNTYNFTYWLQSTVNANIYLGSTTTFVGHPNSGGPYVVSVNASIFTSGITCAALPTGGGAASTSTNGVCL